MGVAIQNARLFEETKRLLAESEQRTAEMTIISGVSQAMVQQLDFQSIINKVGEEVRKVFNGQNTFIALYDQGSNRMSIPYWVNFFGEKLQLKITSLRASAKSSTHDSLVLNTLRKPKTMELSSLMTVMDTGPIKVPILVGEAVPGVICVQDCPRYRYRATPHRPWPLRWGRTRKRTPVRRDQAALNETQRNAELAVINSVRQDC
jgi:GAF domain-containing protein